LGRRRGRQIGRREEILGNYRGAPIMKICQRDQQAEHYLIVRTQT
jgi:hypothetical protein